MALAALGLSASAGAAELFRLSWGSDGNQVGYYNNKVEDFQDPFPTGPNAVAAGPDGRFYIADTNNDSVLVVDGAGKFVARHGKKGDRSLELVRAVAPYGNGELLAGLTRSGDIVRIDAGGKLHKFFVSALRGAGRIGQIQSLAADKAGRVYAGDVAAGRVVFISPEGRLVGEIPWQLSGFSVTPDGTLYTLDRRDKATIAVHVRGADGKESDLFSLRVYSGGETLPGEDDPSGHRAAEPVLSSPRLLGVDQSGNVYLRYVNPARRGVLMVRRYSRDGGSAKEFGEIVANGAEDTFFVTAAGKVCAMDFDADKAPGGAFTLRELQ